MPAVTLLGPAVRGLDPEHGGRGILTAARRDPAVPAFGRAPDLVDARLAKVDEAFRTVLAGNVADLTRVADLAAELLAARPDHVLATLAVDLGYFDQAHFARAALGTPPAAYAQRCARALRRPATA